MEESEVNEQLYEKSFDFIKEKGPVLPEHLAEFIGSNVLYASVLLNDLFNQGKIKQSFASIGESPIYYLPGQEEKLQVLANHLGTKQKEVYDLIKNQKVLREKTMSHEYSQALSELKDFVKGLKVNVDGKEELFYKWYLLSDDEAQKLIQITLKGGKIDDHMGEKKEVKIKEIKQEAKPQQEDNRKRVLIVDDEERILNLIKLSLVPGKYHVDTATNGEKAMELVKTNKPDILILDLMLPGMDGYEVCQKIKEDDETKSTTIMILSAKDQVNDKILGMKIGADDFMTKPFDPRELQTRVEVLLRRNK